MIRHNKIVDCHYDNSKQIPNEGEEEDLSALCVMGTLLYTSIKNIHEAWMLLKKLSIFMIINLLILTNIFTFTMAFAEENSYTTIIGRVTNIDHEKEMISLAMEVKTDDIKEFNIKIGKGTNYIFVRDIKGLLSVDSFDKLKLGDDVSIKIKKSKGEYETFDIEKIVKTKEVKSTEDNPSLVHQR